MYSVDEGNNDIDRYFKIIENEARELRECNPQSGSKPNFNKNRIGVDNYTSGGGSQTSNYNGGDYNSRSNNYENKSEGGYGGSRNYGGSSNNYGSGSSNYGGNSGYGGGGSNSYGGGGGSNSYGGGGSNSYGGGGSNSGYGGGSNTGTDSNNYGGGNSGYGAGSNNYGGGSSSYGGGGGTNSYGGGGSSSYGGGGGTNSYGGGGSNDTSAGPRTSGYGGSSNYGGASDYGSSSNQAQPSFNAPNPSSVATDDWGAKQDFNEPSNNSSNDYRSSNTNYGNEKSYGSEVASNNYDSSSQSQYKSDYNAQTADQNKPYAASTRSVAPSFAAPITEDVDGYQRLDFNRSLISYNEPGNLNIKHIFLNILNRSDLMAYTTKIMECACQDKIVLAIQRDNQLAESYASQLRERGFWAFEVTNKTADPEKLLKQHSVYRCAITTMSYLRDNVDMFQFPSLIINFDHVVSHVKFLERFLAYRNPSTALERKDCCIYEMCFNHSTTSQNLKEYIQSQNK